MTIIILLLLATFMVYVGGNPKPISTKSKLASGLRADYSDYVIVPEDKIEEAELRKAVFRTQQDLDEVIQSTVPIKFLYVLVGYQGVCRQQFHKNLRAIGGQYISPYKVCTDTKYFFIRSNLDLHFPRGFRQDIKCVLKSMFERREIVKILAKPVLQKTFSDMVPKTYKVTNDFKLPPGIWIAKPDGPTSNSGKGIAIVKSQSELSSWRKKCQKDRAITGMAVSRYIQNPKLRRGYKFHLRASIQITTWGTWSVYPNTVVISANQPYKNSDFNNIKIHDTHMTTSEFMELIPITEIPGMPEMLAEIAKRIMIMPRGVWQEQDHGYNIFAPDMLLDDTDQLYILEINYSPAVLGHKKWTVDQTVQFENAYHNWEFAAVKDAWERFMPTV